MTPCIYSSLELTKLFDIIVFNLSLRCPYEVSKAVTFIPVLQRRKRGLGWKGALLEAMWPEAAKPTTSPDLSTALCLCIRLTSKD